MTGGEVEIREIEEKSQPVNRQPEYGFIDAIANLYAFEDEALELWIDLDVDYASDMAEDIFRKCGLTEEEVKEIVRLANEAKDRVHQIQKKLEAYRKELKKQVIRQVVGGDYVE
ncbi:MAG: hypothetical protein DRI61_09595 [Chloroflexi bacterium]|nr:MAG: hypothetical protein DRI61_09595 [Chloroflexota bacterium]